MSVLHSGIYKISNVKYPNFAIDLFDGKLRGAVIGNSVTEGALSQLWKVEDHGGSKFYLENVFTSGSFVGAYHEAADSPLAGSPENNESTLWVAEPVPRTKDVYRITTMGGDYSWFLPAPYNFVTIVLRSYNRSTQPTDAHWKFELQK